MKTRYQLIIGFLLGSGIASAFLLKLQQNCINKWKKLTLKNRGLFLLMTQWINIKQEGKKIENYFLKNKIKRIAIYGMSTVGICLAKELKKSNIEIAYGIDRNAANIYSEIKVVTMNESLINVDAVVVTVIDEFENIHEILSKKMDCPIIAIEDIINEI